jgi:UDP-N-acetylglucosamine 4,6-dehydratase/5-epimerase
MNLNKKNILITGGTGSFGKACVKYILKNYKPNKLVIFSRDELKQFEMAEELQSSKNNNSCLRFFLGDVRDKDRLDMALKGIDYIVHAAALKQVPAAEYNPMEFVKTNIIGAENIIFASIKNKVKRVISLSTDKAANPINLYGATKLAADKLFNAANNLSGGKPIFSTVRYGNVLGSRGSVVPFFKSYRQNINESIPITDINMTRFFISLEDSVKFVLNSLNLMKGGEIFVPKIPSVKIIDLAKAIVPGRKHKIIGARPGEKISETLITKDESKNTLEFKNHYVINSEILGKRNKKKYKLKDFEYNSSTNKKFLDEKNIRMFCEKLKLI